MWLQRKIFCKVKIFHIPCHDYLNFLEIVNGNNGNELLVLEVEIGTTDLAPRDFNILLLDPSSKKKEIYTQIVK